MSAGAKGLLLCVTALSYHVPVDDTVKVDARPRFKFPGDASNPPYTSAGDELRPLYKKLLQVVPGNGKPRGDFNATIGSFNFQDPAGVLARIAESEGRRLFVP